MTPELKAKLSDPAVKKAITYWVMQCVNQMGKVRSERQIKQMLLQRLGGRTSPAGVEYIYRLALMQFEKQKKIVQSVMSHASPQSN